MSSTTRLMAHFNPRSPWGERQLWRRPCIPTSGFQSTLPVGGATVKCSRGYVVHRISIHAPRGGSDSFGAGRQNKGDDFNPRSPWGERQHGPVQPDGCQNFNPRSPWGERLARSPFALKKQIFQSTLPVGGATVTNLRTCAIWRISIHAPRGGSDKRTFAGKMQK